MQRKRVIAVLPSEKGRTQTKRPSVGPNPVFALSAENTSEEKRSLSKQSLFCYRNALVKFQGQN